MSKTPSGTLHDFLNTQSGEKLTMTAQDSISFAFLFLENKHFFRLALLDDFGDDLGAFNRRSSDPDIISVRNQ